MRSATSEHIEETTKSDEKTHPTVSSEAINIVVGPSLVDTHTQPIYIFFFYTGRNLFGKVKRWTPNASLASINITQTYECCLARVVHSFYVDKVVSNGSPMCVRV